MKSERDRSLRLARRDGGERAAQDFRLIGGGREGEAADRGHDSGKVEPELCEDVIDEQELHQQRDAAKDADIRPAKALEPGAARQTRDADQSADHEADADAGEGNCDGHAGGLRQISERVENDLRLHLGKLSRAP